MALSMKMIKSCAASSRYGVPDFMATIRQQDLITSVADALQYISYYHPQDYIRALAEDIGEALGCGAHLAALSRTGAGEFALARALTLDALAELSEAERDAALLPVDALVARLDRLDFDDAEASCLVQGRPVTRVGAPDGLVRVYAAGAFAGVADVREGVVQARRLFAQPQRCKTDG